MVSPELSIIIINWNTKKLLLGCIDSVIASKPKVSYEIVVVDNGSTDGSVEALAKFKGKINLKTISNKTNEGFAKANNAGIRISKGKYILLLNSDIEVRNRAIDQLYEFASQTLDAGVVGAKLLAPKGEVQPSCFHFPTLTGAIKQYWLGIKGVYGQFYPEGEYPTAVDGVVGAAFLITPGARKKVGMLNEKYFFYFEDLDYCRKVKAQGLKTYYLPVAEVIHYHGSTVRKTAEADVIWRKLIPGSKTYHGLIKHYLINFVIWTSQKWEKLF